MATDVGDTTAHETETPDNGPAATAIGRFGFGGKKLKILILLGLVMGGEAALMYFVVPAPAGAIQETEADATRQQQSPVPDVPELSTETVEVPIDSFNVTNSRAIPDTVVHVAFNLVAVVARDQEFTFNEAANTRHKARVRQAVVKVARSCSLEELNDPGLNSIKRLIREEINKVLRKSYVNEVVISEFKTMEQ